MKLTTSILKNGENMKISFPYTFFGIIKDALLIWWLVESFKI